jgi:hypothetical protein
MNHDKPSLARFDRPALDLEELMSATGSDFVYAAYWSILDRRASPAEVKAGVESLNAAMTREDFLILLANGDEGRRKRISPPYLGRLLAMQRDARLSLVGNFSRFVDGKLMRRKFGLRIRICVQRIAAFMRWSRRHSRKALIRMVRQLGGIVRRLLPVRHAPPSPDMTPRSAELYIRLCRALDEAGNRR